MPDLKDAIAEQTHARRVTAPTAALRALLVCRPCVALRRSGLLRLYRRRYKQQRNEGREMKFNVSNHEHLSLLIQFIGSTVGASFVRGASQMMRIVGSLV